MTDPLSQVIELLAPRAVFSKGISGAGRWAVSYAAFGAPGFCAVLEGRCRLKVDGAEPVVMEAGDFVLLPATPAFTMSSMEPGPVRRIDRALDTSPGEAVRHGRQSGLPDVRLQGGYFDFGAPDAGLLVPLLPAMIHIRAMPRLATLVALVGEEASGDAAGRDLVLARLVEVLLVEALRAAGRDGASPGLLRGLADTRIVVALRRMHDEPQRAWTAAKLAREAGLSRATFFDRFSRTVGMRPMEYLLVWRMALAKSLLRRREMAVSEVARRVGYGSSSTFATAFSRHVGQPPGRYARMAALSKAA